MIDTLATTFVTCIEAGLLEQEVILLAKSLRALDSPIARSQMIAVQPRRDTGLSRQTRAALAKLDVDLVCENLIGAYDWNPHLNKAAAMRWAETHVTTPFVTWLDGDMVLLRPLDGLITDAGMSFAAMPANIDQGTDGADGNAVYWEKVSQVVGVPYRPAALVESVPPAKLIYEYYHGGIYTVRRDDHISDRHFAFFIKILEARIASHSCGIYHHDQVALSMAARTAPGTRSLYPREMNYSISPRQTEKIDRAMLQRCAVLHYHDALLPAGYPQIREFLAHLPEGPRRLIEAASPIGLAMPPHRRLLRKLRSSLRRRSMQAHIATCAQF